MKALFLSLALTLVSVASAEKKPTPPPAETEKAGYVARLIAAVEKITGAVEADVKKGIETAGPKTQELKQSLEKISRDLEAKIEAAPEASKKEGQGTLQKLKAFIQSLGDKVFDDANKTAKQILDSADEE